MKHVASPSLEAQLVGLGTLLQLIKRARHAASEQELAFIMVNETHTLLPYRQAVLWRCDPDGGGKLIAISGIAAIERNAPQTLWLNRALRHLAEREIPGMPLLPKPIEAKDLGGTLGEDWAEWLPAYGLKIPLVGPHERKFGVLLLAREQPWGEGEQHILQELADGYAYGWAGFLRRTRRAILGRLKKRRGLIQLAIAAILIGILFLPVRLSVLAPAEVVPLKPTIVRAPLDGVVDRFLIEPNAPVAQGQPILNLDPRAIQNKLDVAKKELATAEAEYRQAAQEAVFDDKSRAKLAVLKGRMDQRSFDVSYTQSLLNRIHVTASRAGLAIFNDPNEWIGRPVTIGERLLEIADPNQAQIEIWLPVADAITLKPGADIEFFLNVSPEQPLHAKLEEASYEATLSPTGLLGYRIRARFDTTTQLPRIGLRGTAKLYGEPVSLFYYLARRPLAAARQFLGW